MNRADFIKIAIDNPEEAARILRAKANKLASCKNVSKTADVLSNTLFISSRTIFRDCKK
jgi:hypothetical protein